MTQEEAMAALSDNGPAGWGEFGGRFMRFEELLSTVTRSKRDVKALDRLNDELFRLLRLADGTPPPAGTP